jgi:hypothetical protein
MERLTYEKILQDLDYFLQLCMSIGLWEKVEQGRFIQYRREIVALMDAIKTRSHLGQDEAQRHKYLVTLMEGAEVSLLLPYLQQCEPSALFLKLKACLDLKAPIMPRDEDSDSNLARNIQFELFLASTLWQSGFPPVFGEPDLKCRVDDRQFFFACKRLFSPSLRQLRRRIGEAAEQIRKSRSIALLPGTRGIIAVSLSRVFNPSQAVQPILNEQQGRQELATWLMNKANEVRYDTDGTDTWELLSHKKIVGILFYVASVFEDFEADCFSPGRYFLGFPLTRESSPDDIAVRKLAEAMKATQY